MPNLFGLAGGTPQKQTKFAPIYNGRWSSGIWTNRSPLRDAATTRLTEKYYGAAGDALIAGSNVEITNRLTLGRRPGNSQFDTVNNYTAVDRFYDFRLFNSTTEKIKVMIDQAGALYALYNGTKTLVFTKSSGAGSAFMQSVGNSLYFGDGIDNKKWLQTLNVWDANIDWSNFPAFSTFIIDTNNNIQQLTTVGVSGGLQPIWSTQQPNSGNHFTGGLTNDGSAQWTNRGNPIENWGIVGPTTALSPEVGSSRSAWKANTFFSLVSVIIDTNGNLQQVSTAGKSGATNPTSAWSTSLGGTTVDGTAIWTMIQTAASLVWQPTVVYSPGHFLIGTASGTDCLFQLSAGSTIRQNSPVEAYLYPVPGTGPVGEFQKTFPTSTGSASASQLDLTSLSFIGQPLGTGARLTWDTIDGAGNTTGTTQPFLPWFADYNLIILGNFEVPVAGQYSFSMAHHDGTIWGIGGGAQLVTGSGTNPIGQTATANMGYPVFGGTNLSLSGGGVWNDSFVVNFPTAGVYPYEVDYAYWYHSGQQLHVLCNGNVIPYGTPISGPTEPIWPAFTTSFAPAYATVAESAGQFIWSNLGPKADFAWAATTNFTLPNTTIIDANGNQEGAFRTGVTGSGAPTFSTILNQTTLDNPNLIWVNQGPASAPPPGSLSTFNGGWQYTIALVNTLDNTVSNGAPLSASTGNFIGAAGITFEPGDGLDPSTIDPQADYVAIFRTTDGESTPFLIPGDGPFGYTLPLSTYLTSGYFDTTPDTGLNNLIQAAMVGENTPPAMGAINLTYHLGRTFYSIGNIVYWTAGPDTPVGNGANGTPPLNVDTYPSLVKRLIPTNSGLLVFTVSDVYIIYGDGTTSNPILPGKIVLQGVGLLSYDALDVNGSIVGFFSTDSQFIIIYPDAGVTYAGFPIGDQLRQNTGVAGTAFDPSKVYVAWHVEGEDQAWYVADGQFGWYRLMPTPAPEAGLTWSPYATIVGGVKAVSSVEVTPGVHRLLLGPTGTGKILKRDLNNVFQDNGQNYPANATVGSAVLAQPGQLATVQFITTDSVTEGTPLVLGVLMDEAVPYYKGPFDILKVFTNDPPNATPSKSLLSQRFYMNETKNEAVCRHMQIKLIWAAENAANEILTLTVFGGYLQEA